MNNVILNNTKVKRVFRKWLLEARGLSESSVDQILRAISLYEEVFPNEDYGLLNSDRAMKFKEKIRNKKHKDKNISSNSVRTYFTSIKTFFEWLCTQPGYKSKISLATLEYLRVTRKESRLAVQANLREFPMIEYVIQLVNSIEIETVVDRRDQALIAFTFLTGMRDAAIVSLPINCFDEARLCVYQYPQMGVNTKFSKSIVSKIFQFDKALLDIVLNWVIYLKAEGLSSGSPVFPRSKIEMLENSYSFKEAEGVEPYFWKTANSLRKIFQSRAAAAELPYYAPHTFRHAAVFYALKAAKNGEEIKAISQNFGHEDLGTTLSVYANLPTDYLLTVLDKMDKNKSELPPGENFEKKVVGMLETILNQKNA